MALSILFCSHLLLVVVRGRVTVHLLPHRFVPELDGFLRQSITRFRMSGKINFLFINNSDMILFVLVSCTCDKSLVVCISTVSTELQSSAVSSHYGLCRRPLRMSCLDRESSAFSHHPFWRAGGHLLSSDWQSPEGQGLVSAPRNAGTSRLAFSKSLKIQPTLARSPSHIKTPRSSRQGNLQRSPYGEFSSLRVK